MNAGENPAAAGRYGIHAMPALSVLRDGEVIARIAGARPERRPLAGLGALL